MERKSQPAKEVGDEYHPLLGLRGGDDLPLGRKTVGDFLGQVLRLPELRNVLLHDRGGHPLALSARSGHGWSVCWGWKELRALELEGGWAEEEEGVG